MFCESANVVRGARKRRDDLRGGCDVRGVFGDAVIDALPLLVACLFAVHAVVRAVRS
jgi:hypothetical protein